MQSHHSPAARLRALLTQGDDCLVMPCCFDAMSARLIEQAGFPLSFMSGFAVAAARAALPDTGLLSVTEMLDQGRAICAAVSIPVIGDGDTGHGNPANVQRTVQDYARAGFAGIMLEDQVAPKRCGHTGVKEVVERAEALRRIRAAVAARADGADLVIVARTDARSALAGRLGPRRALAEAIWRLRACADLGAEVLFLEAPADTAEMARCAAEVPGLRMVNMLEGGLTPVLAPAELAALGYRLAAYPLTLLACAVHAMQRALADLAAGRTPAAQLDFAELRRLVGFDAYDDLLARFADPPAGSGTGSQAVTSTPDP
ncbi:MAG: carboxyvinyl-carboxyphosphonate phosphorylmutase [Chromatiaceae bacterium]|nr:MAG: carboxyvinyl-carboxyphosphonate phosphorylmutase [Chromatiaceae bacterium]